MSDKSTYADAGTGLLEPSTPAAEMSAAKRAMLERWLRGEAGAAALRVIPRRDPSAPTPLSFAQESIWFFSQLDPTSSAYHLPAVIRVAGPLDPYALQASLDALVARHEILRTRFVADNGTPRQVVDAPRPVPVAFADRPADWGQCLRDEIRRPFDLARDVMLRALVVRLGENDHVLALVQHHIATDGWSWDVFFRELAAFYDGFAQGRPIRLPALPLQYGDYAAWQRGPRREPEMDRDMAYWRQKLAGAPPLLDLPADKPRPIRLRFQGGCVHRSLPRPLTEALRRIGQRESATPFMIGLAAFQILLSRWSNSRDVIVATPVAGRRRRETEGLIGFFVNTLALRGEVPPDLGFLAFLRRVREDWLEAFSRQDAPFEKLVEELRPARSASYSPLAQVMFQFQDSSPPLPAPAGLTFTRQPLDTGTAKFDLTLGLEEREGGGLGVALEYDSDLFTAETAARLLGQYQSLLEAIAKEPDGRVGDCDLLGEEERQRQLFGWNETDLKYEREAGVPQLWQRQVEAAPNRPALRWGEERLSYAELEERAQAVAARLVPLGVKPGDLVGVCLERTPRLVAAILGILKIGAAYVPLDPTHPLERRKLILADAQVKVLLTEAKLLPGLPAGSEPRVCLDGPDAPGLGRVPTAAVRPADLAYVLYTSGSTGRPKGVAVGHGAVAALLAWARQTYSIEELSGVLAATSICFDLSVFELFAPLCRGGQVILAADLLQLPQHPGRHDVTLINTVPSAMAELLRLRGVPPSVRTINLAGEALAQSLVDQIYRQTPVSRVFDLYGPTEDTVYSTCALRRADGLATIGRPLPNKQAYILDGRLQPLPIGVAGELCLSGEGLAQGYWRAPALTAEKFLLHPFRPGQRIYRTGDLARHLPTGEIEYLGRLDHQIKLRGYRIELGEVEQALRRLPGVRQAVAVVREDQPGHKRLVAYAAVPEAARAGLQDWRRQLEPLLPGYMIPAALALLDQLPLNANGKIDRKKLPLPEAGNQGKARTAPRTALETRLVAVWESVLGVSPIGLGDIFFEQGGHSLLAVRLIAEIEKNLGVRVPLAAIYQAPSVEGMAALLEERNRAEAGAELVEIQPAGRRCPLFLVHGMAGGMLWGYTNLSRHLGPDQPVYAFKSRGLEGQEEFATLDEMAAHYLRILRRFRPIGPYCLGGYCFGGNIAFEMARRLREQGEEVRLLALFNSSPPNSEFSRLRWTPVQTAKFFYNLLLWAADFRKWKSHDRRQFFHWKLRLFKLRFFPGKTAVDPDAAAPDPDKLVDLRAFPDEQRRLLAAHIRALVGHRCRPYSGRVTLFRSRGYPLLCSFDRGYGWREFAEGGVDLIMLPGKHDSILEEPYVATLAAAIQQRLEQEKARS